MRCQYCGGELLDNAQFCGSCGNKIHIEYQSNPPMSSTDNLIIPSGESQIMMNNGNPKDSEEKVFFLFQMWFIHIVFVVTILILGIPAIVLLIIRLIKYPKKRKGALLGVAGFVGGWILFGIILDFIYGANDRAVKKLVDAGQYEEALEYVEAHYDSTQKSYYTRKADVYEKKGDLDMAAASVLRYTEIVADLAQVDESTLSRLKTYKGRVSDNIDIELDSKIEEISLAIAEKKALEKQLDDEKAARENAEKQLAREKAVNETTQKKLTEERQAKEAAEQQLAEEKAVNQNTQRKLTEERSAKETAEQQLAEEKAAKEALLAEKKDPTPTPKPQQTNTNTVTQSPQPANTVSTSPAETNTISTKTLGVDLVMEAHSDTYNEKYYKIDGMVDEIDDGAYLIKYLSVVNNHKRMYYAWILADDLSRIHVGDNLSVVAKYVGFASGSKVPTLSQYKADSGTNKLRSTLAQKAKIINKDVSFDNLLRYGEYQEFVYFEGEVTAVFENSLNIRDIYGNYYLIYDNRVNPPVVLQGDYISGYGSFLGIVKEGKVWPEISWIVE